MLGAVVLEHAPQLAHARQEQQVAEEDRDPDQLLDHHEHQRVGQRVAEQAGQARRARGRTARSRTPAPAPPSPPTWPRRSPPACRPRPVPAGRWPRCSAPRKPIFSDWPSATTPRTTGQRSTRWRLVHETSGKVWTSISPSRALARRPGGPSPSAPAVGWRTATAQCETPRIITPSSTAWPPTGRSRGAISAPSASLVCTGSGPATGAVADTAGQPARRRLAARRWKRSTRPPLSTSFWRPV